MEHGDLVERLQSLRNELELRFTGQFVENAVCTLDRAKSSLASAQARIAALEAELAGAREALGSVLSWWPEGSEKLPALTKGTAFESDIQRARSILKAAQP